MTRVNNQRKRIRSLALGQLFCLSTLLTACDAPDESKDDGTGTGEEEVGEAGGSTSASSSTGGGSDSAAESSGSDNGAGSEESEATSSDDTTGSGGDSSMSEEGEATDDSTGDDASDSSDDSSETDESGDAGESGDDPLDHIEHEDLGMGVTLTRVNSADHERWIYLDILEKQQLAVEDQANDANWHLAFRRYVIATNGGISGPAGMSVAILEGQDFDTLADRYEGEFIVDGDHDTDAQDATGLVFDDWWDYDVNTHVLTPKERVYVVQLADDRQFAVEVVDYYHPDHATSGFPAFRWVELPRDL